LKTIGIVKTVQYVVKAKVFKDTLSDVILKLFILRGIKLEDVGVKFVKDKSVVVFRGRPFYVPQQLLVEFTFILSEILAGRIYRFKGSYDVVVDVGGFLGETAWYYITEGIAKQVIVFEPYYYELCRLNLDGCNACKVYPYAVYIKSRHRAELYGSGGRIKINEGLSEHHANCVEAETITFNEILKKVSGRAAMKVDCEGCEEYLLEVPCDVIKKIHEYIIEVHSQNILEKLVHHFTRCGFNVVVKIPEDYYLNTKILHTYK